jgi:hypothetical protein
MPIMRTRRRFLTTMALAGAAGISLPRRVWADEPPLETTTVRLGKTPIICFAPQHVCEALLRAEGFTDIRYVGATPQSLQEDLGKPPPASGFERGRFAVRDQNQDGPRRASRGWCRPASGSHKLAKYAPGARIYSRASRAACRKDLWWRRRGNAGESSQASPFTPRTPNTSQEGPTVRIPPAPAESLQNVSSAAGLVPLPPRARSRTACELG